MTEPEAARLLRWTFPLRHPKVLVAADLKLQKELIQERDFQVVTRCGTVVAAALYITGLVVGHIDALRTELEDLRQLSPGGRQEGATSTTPADATPPGSTLN